MAVISLDIPAAKVDRVVVGVARQMNVNPVGLTGVQQAALVKAYLKQCLVDAVQSVELPAAETTARATAQAEIVTNITNAIT